MKCDVENINGCTKILKIEVDESFIKNSYDAFYKEISKTAKVPGFRPGKAPINVLKLHYKKEAKEEVLKKVVSLSYCDALKDKGIKPINYPDFDNINFDDTKLSFEAKVEIKPEIKLKKYKGINVEKEKLIVEEKEIDEVIERFRERAAKFIPIEDRAVEKGDFIVCNMENKVDGDIVDSKKDEWIEVRENEMLKGFADGLIGVKIGETKSIDVDLSDNFPNEKLRGKKAVFTVTVNEIKKKELPDIDEEFLKQNGDFSSVEAMREAVKKDIEAYKKRDIETKLDRALLDKILDEVKFDLPQSYIERCLDGLLDEAIQSYMYQGVPKEFVEAQRDKVREGLRSEAERQVKVALILDAIAIAENIETTEEDMENKFEVLAKQYKGDPAKIKQYYEKHDMLDQLRSEIRNDKVVDFIKENAEIKEK